MIKYDFASSIFVNEEDQHYAFQALATITSTAFAVTRIVSWFFEILVSYFSFGKDGEHGLPCDNLQRFNYNNKFDQKFDETSQIYAIFYEKACTDFKISFMNKLEYLNDSFDE